MSITIRDCLKLPSLSLGKVIAGEKGLGSIVNTISVIEFVDKTDDVYVPNELIISSLFMAKDDINEQCSIIEHSKEIGDVGLILFYSDIIIKGVSKRLIDTANRLNFPLILMPSEDMGLIYSDVINDVMEAIFIDRKTSNYFVNDCLERISQLPEAERTLNTVLSLVSSYAKTSFFLYNNVGNLISASYWPLGNTSDYDAVMDYCRNENNLNSYNEHDVFSDNKRIYKLNFQDKKGVPLSLYALSRHGKLNQQIMSETVEIILLFSTIWNYTFEISSKESLIPALFDGNLKLANYISYQSGFPIEKLNTLIFIDFDANSKKLDWLKRKKKEIENFFKEQENDNVVDIFGDHLVIMTAFDTVVYEDELLCHELFQSILDHKESAKITWFNNVQGPEAIQSSYINFCENIHTATKIYPHAKIILSSQIDFAGKCNMLMDSSNIKSLNHYIHLLSPLTTMRDEDIITTLAVYLLDCNSEVKQTASTLFLHRNTIIYRLNKAKKLLKGDINQMPFANEIYLAVALERIRICNQMHL